MVAVEERLECWADKEGWEARELLESESESDQRLRVGCSRRCPGVNEAERGGVRFEERVLREEF